MTDLLISWRLLEEMIVWASPSYELWLAKHNENLSVHVALHSCIQVYGRLSGDFDEDEYESQVGKNYPNCPPDAVDLYVTRHFRQESILDISSVPLKTYHDTARRLQGASLLAAEISLVRARGYTYVCASHDEATEIGSKFPEINVATIENLVSDQTP